MRKRVKCITEINLSAQNRDPFLKCGLFYNVVEEEIPVIGNDSFIKIESKKYGNLERPRYMFGPILED